MSEFGSELAMEFDQKEQTLILQNDHDSSQFIPYRSADRDVGSITIDVPNGFHSATRVLPISWAGSEASSKKSVRDYANQRLKVGRSLASLIKQVPPVPS